MNSKTKLTLSVLIFIAFISQEKTGTQQNLLRPRAYGEKALLGKFSEYGIALDSQARRTSIERYQKAINRVIEWAGEEELNADKIEIFGSIAKLGKKRPRLGIYIDRS